MQNFLQVWLRYTVQEIHWLFKKGQDFTLTIEDLIRAIHYFVIKVDCGFSRLGPCRIIEFAVVLQKLWKNSQRYYVQVFLEASIFLIPT